MLLGVSGNKAESSAQRWEFGAEMEQGLRITGRGIKGSIWLAVMVESSSCLAASCCFDHVPLRVHCLDMAAFLIQTPHPVLPSALFSFALDSPLAAMLPFSAVLDVTPPDTSWLLALQVFPPGRVPQNQPFSESQCSGVPEEKKFPSVM